MRVTRDVRRVMSRSFLRILAVEASRRCQPTGSFDFLNLCILTKIVNSRKTIRLIRLRHIVKNSVVYQTSVGIANPKQKPTILLCGFESNTLLSKLDCAWDLKGSHTIVCKTFSHTGDHTILSLSPNYFPPLICFWNRQVTPSIGGKKEKSSLNGQ